MTVRSSPSSPTWDMVKPMPVLLASVLMIVSWPGWNMWSSGLDSSKSLTAWNATSWSASQTNLFLSFKRHLRGSAVDASDGALAAIWLQIPMKDFNCFLSAGGGNLAMASSLPASGTTLSLDTSKPQKFILRAIRTDF